jgi:hypothetical protein
MKKTSYPRAGGPELRESGGVMTGGGEIEVHSYRVWIQLIGE